MARPANADAQATRQRILGSAQSLFSARGVGGTSVREIAKSAGVSLAMVHHYFGSKDDLYSACVDAMYSELLGLRGELQTAFVAGLEPDGSTNLALLVAEAQRRGFRFARRHQTAIRLLMRTVVEAGELEPQRQQQMQMPFLRQASELLAPVVERDAGELRLVLQSIISLTVRYALSTERELRLLCDVSRADAVATDRAIALVEEHLVQSAWTLLGVSPPSTRAHQ